MYHNDIYPTELCVLTVLQVEI